LTIPAIATSLGPRRENRVAPSAIFFKKPKAILRHKEGERRFLWAAPWSVFLWNDAQARRRIKMGPSGGEDQDFEVARLAFTITDKH
jgi:hypothetical protein